MLYLSPHWCLNVNRIFKVFFPNFVKASCGERRLKKIKIFFFTLNFHLLFPCSSYFLTCFLIFFSGVNWMICPFDTIHRSFIQYQIESFFSLHWLLIFKFWDMPVLTRPVDSSRIYIEEECFKNRKWFTVRNGWN